MQKALKEPVIWWKQTESSRLVERRMWETDEYQSWAVSGNLNKGNDTVPRVKGWMSENQGGTVYMHPWT